MRLKTKIIISLLVLALLGGVFLYFRYFFTYEQRNIVKRNIETITGQNLTITVFSMDGRIIKRWTGIKKVTSGKDARDYTYFYTNENKYVQLPNSVWYIIEEE